MDLKEKQWYSAETEDDLYYNYIIKISERIDYLSVESDFSYVYHHDQSMRNFREDIFDTFVFEEIELSRDDVRKVLMRLFE